jgi:hypothetical protein
VTGDCIGANLCAETSGWTILGVSEEFLRRLESQTGRLHSQTQPRVTGVGRATDVVHIVWMKVRARLCVCVHGERKQSNSAVACCCKLMISVHDRPPFSYRREEEYSTSNKPVSDLRITSSHFYLPQSYYYSGSVCNNSPFFFTP